MGVISKTSALAIAIGMAEHKGNLDQVYNITCFDSACQFLIIEIHNENGCSICLSQMDIIHTIWK
jgi:hypothetical protein